MVTVAGAAAQVVRRVVRRTTRRSVCVAACGLLVRTTAGRSGELALTWTAPPPMMAPPAVHAHNFAMAIRTDITDLFPDRLKWVDRKDLLVPSARGGCRERDANTWFKRKQLTLFFPPAAGRRAASSHYRTIILTR